MTCIGSVIRPCAKALSSQFPEMRGRKQDTASSALRFEEMLEPVVPDPFVRHCLDRCLGSVRIATSSRAIDRNTPSVTAFASAPGNAIDRLR